MGSFLGLSRARSDARRYPAIDPLISWSKYLPQVAHELSTQVESWGPMVKKAQYILKASDEIRKRMEVVGEEGISLEEMVLHLKGSVPLYLNISQNPYEGRDLVTAP